MNEHLVGAKDVADFQFTAHMNGHNNDRDADNEFAGSRALRGLPARSLVAEKRTLWIDCARLGFAFNGRE